MSAAWHETTSDDLPWTGKAAVMVATCAVVWGAGCIALAAAVVDHLWRRGRR